MPSALMFISALLLSAVAVAAKTVVITVGGNTTANPGAVFQPQSVTASVGDQVVFNFTQGNHTATQSTFGSPCTNAFFTNHSINGFDSNFRDAGNGTAITQLPVNITPDLANQTIWFFDFNTCSKGGVGGININTSSTETLDGFERNAIRLNGTNATTTTTTSGSSASATQTSPGSSTSSTTTSSDAQRVVIGSTMAIPLFFLALLSL